MWTGPAGPAAGRRDSRHQQRSRRDQRVVHSGYHAAMSFFEVPPRPPVPEVARAVAVSPPAWSGPPHAVLPGIAPLGLIIARTEETVVAIAGLQVYPQGFGFTLNLRLRTVSIREVRQFPQWFESFTPEGDRLPDELLRSGVQFADGRKATSLDRPWHDPEEEPHGPVLNESGAGGSASSYDVEYWVWPLPPAGPLAFVSEWPVRGIAESRAEIDAGLIHEAATRAMTLWPDARL
jgi:hypothetical protein